MHKAVRLEKITFRISTRRAATFVHERRQEAVRLVLAVSVSVASFMAR